MKVKHEEISIYETEENEQKIIQVDLSTVFIVEKNEEQIFQYISNYLKNKIDTRILYNGSNAPAALIEKAPAENISLSPSEQKVYDYIKKEAPAGKKSEIVWRWPTMSNTPIPEEIATFVNCTQHNAPRVARYSYTTRINPNNQHNFWLSHPQKIDGEFCAEDLEVDKLVTLFDSVA